MKILPADLPPSSADRAFNYGDGVFTTMLVVQGKIQLLHRHVERLVEDAARIGIQLNRKPLFQGLFEAQSHLTTSPMVLKAHVSAGVGGRGYARSNNEPLVRLSTAAFPSHYAQLKRNGMTVMLAKTRLAIQPALAGVKHLNRLEQVLIKNEMAQAPVVLDDAIVCDMQGHIVESSVGNLFWEHNGQWFTPCVANSGVNGVMRRLFIQFLRASGKSVTEVTASPATLRNVSALIVTNALMTLMPISYIEDWEQNVTLSVSTVAQLLPAFNAYIAKIESEEEVIQ